MKAEVRKILTNLLHTVILLKVHFFVPEIFGASFSLGSKMKKSYFFEALKISRLWRIIICRNQNFFGSSLFCVGK